MRKQVVVMIGLGFLIAGTSASAHHAFAAEFDKDKPIKLEGTVTYQALTVRCLQTMHEVAPLPRVEAERKRLDLPALRALTTGKRTRPEKGLSDSS